MPETVNVKRGVEVELESKTNGLRPFTAEEAATLLSMPQNTGWKLPENSKYQFTDGKISTSADNSTTTVS